MIRLYTRNISVCSMWRSDEGVAPYGCLCQPKLTDKPKFETFDRPVMRRNQNSSTGHSAIFRHPASPPRGRKQGRKKPSMYSLSVVSVRA